MSRLQITCNNPDGINKIFEHAKSFKFDFNELLEAAITLNKEEPDETLPLNKKICNYFLFLSVSSKINYEIKIIFRLNVYNMANDYWLADKMVTYVDLIYNDLTESYSFQTEALMQRLEAKVKGVQLKAALKHAAVNTIPNLNTKLPCVN